jgi:hypothetical protein
MKGFRYLASSSTKEGSVFLCRSYVCCTAVSARVYPRCHGVQVTTDSVHPLSLHYTIKVMLRWTISRPVCLGVKRPYEAQYQICITVRHLRVCWCGAPDLKRGRVCRLQLLLVIASSVILGSESCRTDGHILLSQIRDSPNLEGQIPYLYVSPKNGLAQLYPRALVSRFVVSYDSQG